jgi:hypothetical protein
MYKSLNLLIITTLSAMAVSACGLKNSGSTPEKTTPSTLKLPTVVAPHPLSLPSKLTVIDIGSGSGRRAVGEFVQDLDANTAWIQPGMSRVIRTRDKASKKEVYWRQDVVALNGNVAKTETREQGSDRDPVVTELKLDERDPFESALRLFSEGKDDELYTALSPFMSVYYRLEGDIPTDAQVEIKVRRASYVNTTTFALELMVKLVGRKEADLAIQARVQPTVPRPFHITFKAWGAGGPTQKLLDVTETTPKAEIPPSVAAKKQKAAPTPPVEVHYFPMPAHPDRPQGEVAPESQTAPETGSKTQ